MIISYLTREYLDWGKIFLQSLNLVHPEIKVHLNTRNLKSKEIEKLKELHENLVIDNKILTVKDLSEKHNIPTEEIEKSRKGCCFSDRKQNHRLFMNLIADGDRINSYLDTVKKYKNEKVYLLTDIDLLFRKRIDHVFEKAEKHDVGMKLKAGKKEKELPGKLDLSGENSDTLINISTVTINNNDKGLKFLETWVDYVNSIPMKDKGKVKWGQYAIACAFNECREEVNFFSFSKGLKGVFNSYLTEEAPVWFFKIKEKNKSLDQAKKELKTLSKSKGE